MLPADKQKGNHRHPAHESQRVFRRWDYVSFGLLTALNLTAIGWFLAHWVSFQDWLSQPILFAALSFILIGVLTEKQMRWFLLLWMRRPGPATVAREWRVAVVTTFTPDSEPLAMLEETLEAMVALAYPHDTWVLDEGDDERVKQLCRKLGARHFSRRDLRQYQAEDGVFQTRSRHGNYNAWLHEVGFDHYEIITQFDPDHVPQPIFLEKVLGYFEYPEVGYVQAAQAYYNQPASFIARGAAEETYAHYSSTQMASYALGYPVVTGCHSSHRVAALKEVGGFAPHDADDVLITYFYQARGWRGVYVPEILARGLTPVDWKGYLTQQLKWARSVLDIKYRIYPRLLRKLSLRTRAMGFLHGFSYVQSSLLILLSLLLTAYMLVTGIAPEVIAFSTAPKLAVVFVTGMLCELYRQRFYLDWPNEKGFHWRASVLRYAKWPYLLLALFQVLTGHRAPFPINPKIKTTRENFMLLCPHLVTAVVISAAALIGISKGLIVHPLLYLWSATVVVGSLALLASERMAFPEPYDGRLRARERRLEPSGARSQGAHSCE